MKRDLKLIGLLLLALCVVLSAAGCAPSIDNKEDPLAGYTVDSILPFDTNPPVVATATPSPTPNPETSMTPPAQSWQSDPSVGGPQITATPTPAPQTVTQRVALERLEMGMSGDAVLQMQQRLIELGYLSGSADGNFGAQTKAAVKAFQKALGLSQTGVATVALQEKMFLASAPVYVAPTVPSTGMAQTPASSQYSTLIRGDKGDDVAALQSRLISLGYLSGYADGSFGAKTETAVKRFQAMLGLTQNGVASPALQERLFASNAPAAPVSATAVPTARPTATPAPRATAAPASQSGYVDLQRGDTGDAVKRLQQRLKDLGYFTHTTTGKFYSETEAAVKRFQEALGLTPTGIATASLQTKLFASNAPTYQASATATQAPAESGASGYTTLQFGSTGEEVRNLQKRLIALGYLTGKADGDFGRATENAIKAFQAAIGYSETGLATQQVQEYLFSPYAPAYNGGVAPTQVPAAPAAPTAAPAQQTGYRELRSGDSGDEVKRLQQRLQQLGYFPGNIGGNYLDKTTAAVKLFEAAIGWNQDGVATSLLQEYLFSANAPSYTMAAGFMQLEAGDTGIQVQNLQSRLISLGYLSGKADGDFGAKTTAAVKDFQQTAGLTVDGIAGLRTISALFAAAAPTAAPTQAPTQAPAASGYTELRYGMSGDAVKRIQQRLKDLGYFNGNVAGNYLEKTQAAVVAFQNAIGWPADGTATPALQEYLFSSAAPSAVSAPAQPTQVPAGSGYPQLSYGMSGNDVKRLQQRLLDLGYFTGKVAGNYLEKTQAAVVAFQKAIGWSADGIATPALQEYLFSASAPYASSGSSGSSGSAPAPQTDNGGAYTVLQTGAQGEQVKRLQERLIQLGWLTGSADGDFGTKTREALEEFQYRIGIEPSGTADIETQETLFSSAAPTFVSYVELSYGSQGEAVATLQRRLIQLGYLADTAANVDGDYGEGTQAAVSALQQAMGMPVVNGIASEDFQRFVFSGFALDFAR